MKIIKYSDILKYDRIVHYSQKDIRVDYDRPLIKCSAADDALIVFCHNGDNSLLERQCIASNLPFVKLGHNIENWINTYKPFLLFDYLSNNKRKLAGRIILFLDAYDVILPRVFARLIKVYKRRFYNYALFNATNASMGSKILGYGRGKIDEFENELCEGKRSYLNAGVAIGDYHSLLAVYRDVVELMVDLYPCHFREHQYSIRSKDRAIKREQPFVRLAIVKNKSPVRLDYHNEITMRLRPTKSRQPLED